MPGRILVVDDIPTSRLLARAKLTAAYYDVLEAESGERALETAREEQPDMILLDVIMPGIDGFETCRQLKGAPETEHIPVVMLTALDNVEDRTRGLEAGADDFLSKPFDDIALLSRVNSLTRMKMMIDELRLRDSTTTGLGLGSVLGLEAGLSYGDAQVLLVTCDRPLATEIASEIRRHLGSAVELAAGEAETRALMRSNSYDAFVIGTDLADGEPMRIAAMLRGHPETRQAALMMMVHPEDREAARLALDMGVSDYLTLPPDYPEMAARMKVQLRRKYYSDQLRNTMRESMRLAVTDPLTGLYNRRYSNAHLDTMIARSPHWQGGLAAMVLDLDRFKQINDTHGHSAGDAVLIEFARRLRENVRSIDLVSRIGGEEFLVVMPDIQPDTATAAAERIRNAVESPGFTLEGEGAEKVELSVTVSIGLALLRVEETGAALLRRADTALYTSKTTGRNIVTMAAA